MDTVDPFQSLRDATSEMLHWQHANLRKVVTSLSAEALNWVPVPGSNSIAVLVAHTLDAECELMAAAASILIERDNTTSFRFEATSADELVAWIDRVEREIDGYLEQLSEDHLATSFTRRGYTERGAWRLLHAVGHTREHVGQALLTRQLWEHRTHH